MIQIALSTDKKPGLVRTISTFPATFGRAKDSTVSLPGRGVKSRHFEIDLNPETGFELTAEEGSVSVDGTPVQKTHLANGARIQAGSADIRFWISPVEAPDQTVREQMVWMAIFAMGLLQVFLIFALLWR